jgi:hypothetical protein
MKYPENIIKDSRVNLNLPAENQIIPIKEFINCLKDRIYRKNE